MTDLTVTMTPTDELVEHDGNAKLHPLSQIEQIEESIEEFSFADPIAVWHDPDGRAVVVEGHGRLLAARRLGMREVPTISLDHLSDEQRRAYGLVHNQLTISSGFDFATLQGELAALDSDLGAYGLDEIEMPDLDGFFEDYDADGGERGPRTVRCPHCGMEVEV